MNIAKPLIVAVALALLSLPACGGTGAEDESPIGTTQQAVHVDSNDQCAGITHNAISHNAISHNAISHNAISQNAISHNALTDNAISHNAITMAALEDPNARELLSFIVSCALPADQTVHVTVDGVAYSYQGQLGLAPEWGEPDGSCDERCQQWVSACLLARVDFLGQKRLISVRGENKELASCPSERATFTQREATYYGNLFVTPQLRYACLSPGQTEDPRVCGPSLEGCVVDVLGSCDDLCGKVRADGSFPDCRAPDADDQGRRGDGDDRFKGSITVFLEP
jgi:hypothetical protein